MRQRLFKNTIAPSIQFPVKNIPKHKPRSTPGRWLLVLGVLIFSVRAMGQPAIDNVEAIPLPEDFSRVHFYLITVDVGDAVWDNFGHTALRVVDENTGTDTVFNWGLFDTSGGLVRFSLNFFQGVMDYQLGTSTPAGEFNLYRQQQRTVWQDRINLNTQQKRTLYQRLAWNLRPENVIYAYDYFDDNCTTRVRDYLDEALGGRIAGASGSPTDNTYRDLVTYHYRSLPLIEFSLDLLMNSAIDRPVSEWEEMFLPLALRARLMALPSDVTVNGERQPLLSESMVITEFVPPARGMNPYYVASTVLLAPALFLFLLMRKVSMSYFASHSRVTLRGAGFSYRLLGLVGLLVAVFSGVYGCLMLGGWFFSGHEDLYANVNLLLCWPTDLLGAFLALRWLFFAKPWPLTHNSTPFYNYYMLVRLFSIVVYMVLAGFELTAQAVEPFLLTVAPGLLLLGILIWIVGFEPARSKNLLT